MSKLIVLNQLLEIRACCYAPTLSQLSENRYTYQATNLIGAPDQAMVALQFNNLASGLYSAWLPTIAQYQGCIVRSLNNPIYSQTVNRQVVAGIGGSAMVPGMACGIISKYSDTKGPSGRGRVYLPFVDTQNMLASGELDPVNATPLMDAIRAGLIPFGGGVVTLTDGVNSVDLVPVLVGSPPGPATTKLITSVVSQTKIGTQRSRSDYGALNPLTP